MCDAYNVFVRMEGLSWNKPRYQYSPKLPFVPTTDEIDVLIAGCGRKLRVYLQGLKETGADPGELYAVEWTDIDFKRKKVAINYPVKGHNPRILNVSRKWLAMLSMLRRESQRVWTVKYVMGHKTLRATQRYVELYKQVYGNLKPQDYIVKIVRSSEEAKQLLKVGFEYVNEINGEYLYRKARIG